MFTLTILLIIQFSFCLIFFLYFRQKITEHLKLKEFRKEIDEVIILFNRQAEKHISYLESLLENDVFKKQNSINPSSPAEENFAGNRDNHLSNFSNPDPKPQAVSYKKAVPTPTTPTRTPPPREKSLPSLTSQPTLPPQAVHAFYAQFSTPTTKATETEASLESFSSPTKRNSLKEVVTEKILLLFQKGLTISQIAKHLSISTAEVKIILKLNQKI